MFFSFLTLCTVLQNTEYAPRQRTYKKIKLIDFIIANTYHKCKQIFGHLTTLDQQKRYFSKKKKNYYYYVLTLNSETF